MICFRRTSPESLTRAVLLVTLPIGTSFPSGHLDVSHDSIRPVDWLRNCDAIRWLLIRVIRIILILLLLLWIWLICHVCWRLCFKWSKIFSDRSCPGADDDEGDSARPSGMSICLESVKKKEYCCVNNVCLSFKCVTPTRSSVCVRNFVFVCNSAAHFLINL